MCCCGLEPKTTQYYLLRCNLYSDLRAELLNDVCALSPSLKNLSHEKLLNILLYGSESFCFNKNKKIVKSAIKFLFQRLNAYMYVALECKRTMPCFSVGSSIV